MERVGRKAAFGDKRSTQRRAKERRNRCGNKDDQKKKRGPDDVKKTPQVGMEKEEGGNEWFQVGDHRHDGKETRNVVCRWGGLAPRRR